jgi:hypothetical protein
MHWCAEGELAELWRVAGLRDVRFGPLVVSATAADRSAFCEAPWCLNTTEANVCVSSV